MTITKNTKSSMPKTENIKEFMVKIKEYSQLDTIDKFIVGTLMSKLMTKKFDWTPFIHDHVTRMVNLRTKLILLGMDGNKSFLVQFIINSLRPDFG